MGSAISRSGYLGLCVLAAVLAFGVESAAIAQMNYRSVFEARQRLVDLAATTPGAEVYAMEETSAAGVFSWVFRMSSAAGGRGSFERNSVLFECGMHGREWLASESCLWFAEWLLDNAGTDEVTELLSGADIWILTHTNPAGRMIDDWFEGDPTRFTRVCRGGANTGQLCSSSSQCGMGFSCGSGWRGNANFSQCELGVDLARNFSSDWNAPVPNVCSTADGIKYPGPAPFSEPETRTMRRLVHNFGFSSVVIMHAPDQKLWKSDAGASASDALILDRLVQTNLTALGANAELQLPRAAVGTSSGQFLAWLSRPSDRVGDLDEGTVRAVSTFFVELPFTKAVYGSDDYSGDPYSHAKNDGSNRFHPSGEVIRTVFDDSILPVMRDMTRQAGLPNCPFDPGFVNCLGNDFGLVGAKIASTIDDIGALDVDPVTFEETLETGEWSVVFAVQNMSAGSAWATTKARVRVLRSGMTVVDQDVAFDLAPGQRATAEVPVVFETGHDYFVEIELDGDDSAGNNLKSFAFRVVGGSQDQLLQHVIHEDLQFALDLADGWIQLGGLGGVIPEQIGLLDATVAVELEISAFDAAGGVALGTPETLQAKLLLRGRQSRSGVVHSAQDKSMQLEISTGKPGRDGRAPARVRVALSDSSMKGLSKAQLVLFTLTFPTGHQIVGTARAEIKLPPPNLPSKGEERDEHAH